MHVCSRDQDAGEGRRAIADDAVAGRVLSSQTIGVEFSSKIIKVGTGSRRKRIKLQVTPAPRCPPPAAPPH